MSADATTPPTVGGVVVRPAPPRSSRWAHLATLVLEIIASVILFLMMLFILANVLGRTLFGHPIAGTNELVGYIALPAVVFIGYIVAQARGQSIEAEILYQRFPRQIRREVRFVTSLISALACFGFAWYGLTEAIRATEISRTAPASDIFIAPIYWFVPAAFGVLIVLFVLDAIRALRGRFDNENVLEEALDDPAVG
jgi:TRAP-type C4-dicarboxylate transport system permease small subunit